MSNALLEPIVRSVVKGLVGGNYAATAQACTMSRLTADDLIEVIREYGRTLVDPPPDAYRNLDFVSVRESNPPAWSVLAPLWSREEGRSDLTLELTVTQVGERWEVQIDDLHVL